MSRIRIPAIKKYGRKLHRKESVDRDGQVHILSFWLLQGGGFKYSTKYKGLVNQLLMIKKLSFQCGTHS